MALSIDLFDYSLPEHLIAQKPVDRRDQSRLLVVDRKTKRLSHHRFSEIGGFLRAGDILFRNAVSVLPARLEGQRPTGGIVECFLLKREPGETEAWWCLLKPGRKLPVGSTFRHPSGCYEACVRTKQEDGTALVHFEVKGAESLTELANRIGQIPLPPYILRETGDTERSQDQERYQTVYANSSRQVAVAAPTAGLHFTAELLERLSSAGMRFEDIHLHVGLGTFKPIASATIEEHPIHREFYEMPPSAQTSLFQPGQGRRIAVGTTSVRAIEDFLRKHPSPKAEIVMEEAGIYLYPPQTFKGVDALITNFHQPRSTLLCLVSAFLSPGNTEGIAWLKDIYAEAIQNEYRFFSYGDAMLIL